MKGEQMSDLLGGIVESERQVRIAALHKYGEEFKIIETTIEFVIEHTNLFSNMTLDTLGPLQAARLSLIIRSLHSIRMATVALTFGYYQQALALLRMVAEDQLVARDAERHPPTLDALMTNPARIEPFLEMAKRESSEFGMRWKDYYGMLSASGAHPRPESVVGLIAFDPIRKVHTLQPGPLYDENKMENILRVTKIELKEMIETVLDLVKNARQNRVKMSGLGKIWTKDDLLDLIKRLSPDLNTNEVTEI